jgi:hypothetical protein
MKLPQFKIEKLVNKPGNEMWRIGGGFHAYRGYFRIDIGTVGYRITRDFDYTADFNRLYNQLTDENQNTVMRHMDTLMAEARENPSIETIDICRGGNCIVRERVDLWQKMWARTRELLRAQRTMK